MIKCKLKKGDEVLVIRGKDRGKKGKILRIIRKENRAIVENINLVEKKQRPTQDNPQGGIIKIEEAIPVSSLQIVCPSCQKNTRIGIRLLENNQKIRYCKKCNESLDKK